MANEPCPAKIVEAGVDVLNCHLNRDHVGLHEDHSNKVKWWGLSELWHYERPIDG